MSDGLLVALESDVERAEAPTIDERILHEVQGPELSAIPGLLLNVPRWDGDSFATASANRSS